MTNEYLLRPEYQGPVLELAATDSDPMRVFASWYEAAVSAGEEEANAMSLATVDPQGQPHSRMVLLKAFNDHEFQFFTNYQSHKAQQLNENPKAALLLFWPKLRRQVRIEGVVNKLSRAQSAEYFATRPRGSQLGAHISKQSQPINGRQELEQIKQQLETHYHGQSIPIPDHWGGYSLLPHKVEFWQGQPNRLHDRIVFSRDDGQWQTTCLAP